MSSSKKTPFFIQVAIPGPLRRCFDYLPAANAAGDSAKLPLPGMRVKVPFGKQTLHGVVSAIVSSSDLEPEKLKPLLAILDNEPLFEPELLALYRWASDYYHYPLGLALQTSLPRQVREGEPLELPRELIWQLIEKDTDNPPSLSARAIQQQKVYSLFQQYKQLDTAEASVLLNAPAGPFLKALAEKGLIEQVPILNNTPVPQGLKNPALTLNQEQSEALQAIRTGLGQYACYLLEGITGSGKTEVYLQLITSVLEKGQQALVLVPEINLTPQTIARFKARFHANIVSFHSALNDGDRFKGWMKARSGEASIVIGTRSALFTPMPNLGLIIIDEEHDNSYKQQDGFRYSARDTAIYYANLRNIPVVLGSATPSLESLHNALTGRYQHLQLTQRAGVANLPSFTLLDLKGQELKAGYSLTLLEMIKTQLQQNHQVLVFINRRGFAPQILCQVCGWTPMCSRCDRAYTLHQSPATLHCHHCDTIKPLPHKCEHCNSGNLAAIGHGTERSEDLLKTEFPDYPVIRIDRDSTRKKGSLEAYLETINSGIPCIMVGTQMLAKGHHFPDVTLVAIVDTDSGLFSADFRGQEQLGQLLTQVAGRAGRSEQKGIVAIQTWHSEHPALNSLINSGYGHFARMLLKERENGAMPPFSHMLLLKAEATNRALPQTFLARARQFAEAHAHKTTRIIGPMPAPLEKRAGKFRAQLLFQADKKSHLHYLASQLSACFEQDKQSAKVRWALDMDPLDFS